MDIGPIYYEKQFSNKQVQQLLDNNLAVDSSKGGLVLGRSHDEGGIYMLINYGYCYKVMGEMEGYEFLLNVALGYLMRNSIKDINNHDRDEQSPFVEYDPGPAIPVIDTRNVKSPIGAKFILIEGRGHQMIVNKHSTKVKLNMLSEANQRYVPDFEGQSFLKTEYFNIMDKEENRVLDKIHLLVNPDHYWKPY